MLKPRQNKLIYSFFAWYINRVIKSDFKRFKFNKIKFDKNRSVLLLANHFSWWDGFLMFQLNRLYFGKKFYVMITEDNHQKVWFLKYLGSFSVRKGSRSMIETLAYAGKLLNDPQNLVLIFPQGKLYSNHTGSVEFQKGLMNLISNSSGNFQCLFAALFVDYFAHRKPAVTCYLQEYKDAGPVNLESVQSAYNQHYQTSRQEQAGIAV
jgi:Acyltransferase